MITALDQLENEARCLNASHGGPYLLIARLASEVSKLSEKVPVEPSALADQRVQLANERADAAERELSHLNSTLGDIRAAAGLASGTAGGALVGGVKALRDDLVLSERKRDEVEKERDALRAKLAKPIVWADDATPFSGPQVLDLLRENDSLRAQLSARGKAPEVTVDNERDEDNGNFFARLDGESVAWSNVYGHALGMRARLETVLTKIWPPTPDAEEKPAKCDCGRPLTQCTGCAVEDYQAQHPSCVVCCSNEKPGRCIASLTLRDDEHATCTCELRHGHEGAHVDGQTSWTDATTKPEAQGAARVPIRRIPRDGNERHNVFPEATETQGAAGDEPFVRLVVDDENPDYASVYVGDWLTIYKIARSRAQQNEDNLSSEIEKHVTACTAALVGNQLTRTSALVAENRVLKMGNGEMSAAYDEAKSRMEKAEADRDEYRERAKRYAEEREHYRAKLIGSPFGAEPTKTTETSGDPDKDGCNGPVPPPSPPASETYSTDGIQVDPAGRPGTSSATSSPPSAAERIVRGALCSMGGDCLLVGAARFIIVGGAVQLREELVRDLATLIAAADAADIFVGDDLPHVTAGDYCALADAVRAMRAKWGGQ